MFDRAETSKTYTYNFNLQGSRFDIYIFWNMFAYEILHRL